MWQLRERARPVLTDQGGGAVLDEHTGRWTHLTPTTAVAVMLLLSCPTVHPTTDAVLQQDGTIVADSPGSPSLTILRDWLASWEDANRPAPETYSPSFVNHNEPGLTGWSLRLARERHRTGPGRRPSPCTAATSSPRRMAFSTEVSDAVIADK
ncbi:hypothetical protein [Streptomyces sioyaensis]|uniref:hypothetical protein n=1 Tax=Streptomyces sioyaensis TaxID=67364 RepID=UPI0037961C11